MFQKYQKVVQNGVHMKEIQDFISFAEFDNVPGGRYEEAQINAIRYLSRNLSKVGKVFYMPEE